ncbi:31216_t:CDS:2, partial [Racocetra persica]
VDLNTVINEIEAEKNQNTLAFRTINSDFYVDNALTTLYLKHNLLDQPKLTESERKAKVTELSGKVGDARKKVGINNKKIFNLQARRDNLYFEKQNQEKLGKRKEQFLKILKGDLSSDFKDPSDNSDKKLNLINLTIKDYAGDKILKKDGDGTVNKSVTQLLNDARGYLNNLKDSKYDLEKKVHTPLIQSPLLSGLFGERMYNSKGDLLYLIGDFGFSFTKVLKDIGAENLKKIVEKVPGIGDNEKKRLKKYAEEITKFIFYTESSHGLSYSEFFDKNKKALVDERKAPSSGDQDWYLLEDQGDVPVGKRSTYLTIYKYATEDPKASPTLKEQATQTKKIPDD